MGMDDMKLSRILIVDDVEDNISLLKRILVRAGFERVHGATDPLLIDGLLREEEPDIVLLDMHMPGMDGLQVLRLIRERVGPDNYLPVLMLTADMTSEVKQQGLQAGANDFLTKPYDRTEVILRINNLLKTRQLHKQMQRYNSTLEEKVRERTRELEQAQLEMLELLGRASEYRDDQTGEHTKRVGLLAEAIAAGLGLSPQEREMIRLAAPLHDIGKIAIPDHILLKPGRFEPEEFERMKAHSALGAGILEGSSFEVLKLAETIARSHHEKWDGTGYPQGLKGEEIPLAARIVALADFYDALMHERPYKKAWTVQETMDELERQRGKHFDPQIVDTFKTWAQQAGLTG